VTGVSPRHFPLLKRSPIGMYIDTLGFTYYYASRNGKRFPSPKSQPRWGGFR